MIELTATQAFELAANLLLLVGAVWALGLAATLSIPRDPNADTTGTIPRHINCRSSQVTRIYRGLRDVRTRSAPSSGARLEVSVNSNLNELLSEAVGGQISLRGTAYVIEFECISGERVTYRLVDPALYDWFAPATDEPLTRSEVEASDAFYSAPDAIKSRSRPLTWGKPRDDDEAPVIVQTGPRTMATIPREEFWRAFEFHASRFVWKWSGPALPPGWSIEWRCSPIYEPGDGGLYLFGYELRACAKLNGGVETGDPFIDVGCDRGHAIEIAMASPDGVFPEPSDLAWAMRNAKQSLELPIWNHIEACEKEARA